MRGPHRGTPGVTQLTIEWSQLTTVLFGASRAEAQLLAPPTCADIVAAPRFQAWHLSDPTATERARRGARYFPSSTCRSFLASAATVYGLEMKFNCSCTLP